MRYLEAISPDDQRDILDLERQVINSKEDLIGVEDADEKESIKQRIEDLKQQITDIKDRAKDESFAAHFVSRIGKKEPIPIFKNPTQREMRDLTQEIRALFDLKSKDIYVSSFYALHKYIFEDLKKEGIVLDIKSILFIATNSINEVSVDDYDGTADFSSFYDSPFFQKYLKDYKITQNGKELR